MVNKMWFRPKERGVKRVLFHAINHIGLGHLNRAIAVAQWLQAGIPDLEVLFIIEGGEDFIEPTGFPWVLVYSQVSEFIHTEQITRRVLDVFQPDLFIYETKLREPVFEPVMESGVKQLLMGNVGDLLRDQLKEKLDIMNKIDMLLVLQPRDEVVPADRELIDRYSGKTLFAGPLVRQKMQSANVNLRQQLGLKPEDKPILLTFGGGGYDLAQELLYNILAAKSQVLAACPEAKVMIITGPHYSGALPEKDEFIRHVSVFETYFTDFLNISSAIVCMAGYNTVNEVAASGIPAICVPSLESDDQVGAGGIAEYAQRFPHVALSSTQTDELARHMIDALTKKRDASATSVFQRRAEAASRQIVNGIQELLNSPAEKHAVS